MTRLELAHNKVLIHAEAAEDALRSVSNYLVIKAPEIALDLRTIANKIHNARVEEAFAKEEEDYRHHLWWQEEHAAEDEAWRALEAKS